MEQEKKTNMIWDKVFSEMSVDDISVPSNLARSLNGYFTQLLPADSIILEAGSGAGELSCYLAMKGYKVSLLDLSMEALSLSKQIFSRNKTKGSFIEGDLFKMPFKNKSFDCVWNSGVMEHFSEDSIVRGLVEMRRVSKDYVIVLVPNAMSVVYRLWKWVLESNNQWPYGVEFPKYSMEKYFKMSGINLIKEIVLTDDQMTEHQMIPILGKRNLNRAQFKRWIGGLGPEDPIRKSLGYLLMSIGRISNDQVRIENYQSDGSNNIFELKTRIRQLEGELDKRNDSHQTKNKFKFFVWFVSKGIIKTIYKKIKKVLPAAVKMTLKRFLVKINFPVLRKHKKLLNKILLTNKDIKGVIIYPPTIGWFIYLFQRPQQLAKRFAKMGYLFFFCEYGFVKGGFQKLDNNLYRCSVDTLNTLKIVKDPILYISLPTNISFTKKYKYSKLIYSYIDDIEIYPTHSKKLIDDHKNLMKKADLVFTSANSLYSEASTYNPKTILCPNGVDYHHFSSVKIHDEIPNELVKIKEQKKPVIGYYGALANWVDYKLILYCAKKRPDYHFLIIGPSYDYSKDGIDFNLDNVTVLDAKGYDVLPRYLAVFDVATVPFKVNKITHSCSPIKIFEYMAGGKPIVTTAIPECRKYKSIFVSESYDEYLQNIEKALRIKNNEEYLELLDGEAKNNTWEKRAELIIHNIESIT